MRRRCGRCGSKGIFDGWFRMKERCPRCGYRFEREEGSFTGVYLINLAVTEGLMMVALLAFIVVRGVAHLEVPLLPVLLVTGGAAVIVPIVFYPFAKATWAAVDLVMRPLEPVEEAEAHVAKAAADAERQDGLDASEPEPGAG